MSAAIDYRDLLARYMKQVLECEGVLFVGDEHLSDTGRGIGVRFTREEVAELRAIAESVCAA